MMRSLVFDVSTTDPLTFVVAGGLLAAIGLFASYVPARRATRIDPTVALRCE
jgi:putative ABC transport system permease protein